MLISVSIKTLKHIILLSNNDFDIWYYIIIIKYNNNTTIISRESFFILFDVSIYYNDPNFLPKPNTVWL